ncbi:MAG: hypothetical protein WBN94_05365, partial [Methanothrix sp.]
QFVVNAVQKLSSTKDNPEISAVDWAFDNFDNVKETMYIDLFIQEYSWKDAETYFKAALASPNRGNENYGKAWRALGETMHLMADMTVPAHVRNDGHAAKLRDPDPYESTTTGDHVESYSDPLIYMPAKLTYKQEPMKLMEDVADFTNSNFLSKDTIPKQGGHTYPEPSIDGLIPDKNGYLHNTVDGRDVKVAALESWFSGWLHGRIYTLDNIGVLNDQRSILIPTAIRANTALLDRFLPRFEVKVTKKETEPGSGRYEVHGEIVQADRDAWNTAEWPKKLIIRNGANIVITHEDGRVEKSPVTLIEPEKDLNEFTREVEAGPEDEISLEYDLGGYVVKGGQSETKGTVLTSVSISGGCPDDFVAILTDSCDSGLADVPIELTFTYLPPAYSKVTPETIRGITDEDGQVEFKDVPAGSKFKIKAKVKTMEKELEGTMPDPAGYGLYLDFNFKCVKSIGRFEDLPKPEDVPAGTIVGITVWEDGSGSNGDCGVNNVNCTPECDIYPI